MPIDQERDTRIRQGLADAGLDAVLAWRAEELVITTGACPQWGMSAALYPRTGDPVAYPLDLDPDDAVPQKMTVKRYAMSSQPGFDTFISLKNLLNEDMKKLGVKTVGVAQDGGRHVPYGNSAENSPFCVPLIEYLLSDVTLNYTDFFAKQAVRKTAYEVSKIQKANDIAAFGLRAFYENLQPGKTEAEVAAAIEGAIQSQTGKHGVSLARGWAFVQAGENSVKGGTYSRSSGRALKNGDMVLLEMATFADGYWSDLTRMGIVGSPSAEQKRLLDTVRQAQRAAIEKIKPGVSCAAVDSAARDILNAAGYGEGFTHHTGHHVGFRYHDFGAILAPGVNDLLEEGMIVTVEPGAYGAAYGGGCRIEDNVLVTNSGYQILSDASIGAS